MALVNGHILPSDDDERYVKHTWYIIWGWTVLVTVVAILLGIVTIMLL